MSTETPRPSSRSIPLELIATGDKNPREDFAPEALERLAESIREHGLLQPLVVRPFGGTYFELLAGERRLRALRRLGWAEAPCTVIEADDQEGARIALIENLLREDLNPVEEASGYRRLIEGGMTQSELGKALGRSQSVVNDRLAVLELPEGARALVAEGRLRVAHAVAIERKKHLRRFPKVVEGLAELAAEGRLTSSSIEDSLLPEAAALERKGLVQHLDRWQAPFDIAGCKECVLGAYVNAAGSYLAPYCLRPDHYRELKKEAEAAQAELAAKMAEANKARLEELIAKKKAEAKPAPIPPPKTGEAMAAERAQGLEPSYTNDAPRASQEERLEAALSGEASDAEIDELLAEDPQAEPAERDQALRALAAAAAAEEPKVPALTITAPDGTQTIPGQKTAPGLPSLSELPSGSYRLLSSSRPEGCTESCQCLAYATDYSGHPTPICIDPACHRRLSNAEGKKRAAEEKAAKLAAEDRLLKLGLSIDIFGAHAQAFLAWHILSAENGAHVKWAAQTLGIGKLAWWNQTSSDTYEKRRKAYLELGELAPEKAARLALLAALRADVLNNLTIGSSEYRGRASSILDWLGEELEAPAEREARLAQEAAAERGAHTCTVCGAPVEKTQAYVGRSALGQVVSTNVPIEAWVFVCPNRHCFSARYDAEAGAYFPNFGWPLDIGEGPNGEPAPEIKWAGGKAELLRERRALEELGEARLANQEEPELAAIRQDEELALRYTLMDGEEAAKVAELRAQARELARARISPIAEVELGNCGDAEPPRWSADVTEHGTTVLHIGPWAPSRQEALELLIAQLEGESEEAQDAQAEADEARIAEALAQGERAMARARADEDLLRAAEAEELDDTAAGLEYIEAELAAQEAAEGSQAPEAEPESFQARLDREQAERRAALYPEPAEPEAKSKRRGRKAK